MTMGEPQVTGQGLEEEQVVQGSVRRCRRNAMWNIFEGVDDAVLEKVAGLSLEEVQQLMENTMPQCLSHDIPSSSSSSSSSSCGCDHTPLQRSFSTMEGESMQAMLTLQNRHRRNAVGNLFDLLTLSQKLLLMEHLQARGFQMDEDVFSLADLSSSSSSSSSSSQSSGSSGSTVSSPRSQGEIVCR